MTDTIQQTPADIATKAAVAAHISGDREKAAPLFNRATVEHQRAAAAAESGTDQGWRDGTDAQPLSLMPAAPSVATSEVDSAIAKLREIGGDHAALVQDWQTSGANVGEELSYARAAFKSIAANDPDLIARVDASGLGDHPSVLKFLARQGRLDAGRLGDFTISRNSNERHIPMNTPRTTNRNGSRETQGELDRLLASNPPGSQGYKNPAVQQRVQQLHQILAGSDNVIGRGGRTA